jgi:hypothetical protein
MEKGGMVCLSLQCEDEVVLLDAWSASDRVRIERLRCIHGI